MARAWVLFSLSANVVPAPGKEEVLYGMVLLLFSGLHI